MRLNSIILAAALAVGVAGAAAAQPMGPPPGHGMDRPAMDHHDMDRHDMGRHRGRMMHRGWNGHRHCTTRWVHHHRVRRCW